MGIRALLVFVVVILTSVKSNQVLEKKSSCSCYLPNSTVVDISSLASSTDLPKFYDETAQDPGSLYLYSYNPCNSFTLDEAGAVGNLCKDVAICQRAKGGGGSQPYYFNLGLQDTVKYELKSSNALRKELKNMATYDDRSFLIGADDEHVTFSYFDDEKKTLRTGMVVLTCSPTSKFIAVGEIPGTTPIQFIFELSDPAACPVAGGSSGLSIGSILCIVFFVCLILYIIAGILVMKFVKKVGGSDLVPNKEFWIAVPGYVRDGAKFTVSKVTGKGDTYQQI